MGLFLPYDEQIIPGQFKDQGLIESAAGRPFQTAFGVELYPSLAEKAAALFHSLACNHCFLNGNKRTAVIALDFFLAGNMHVLTMTSDEVYILAKRTATANEEGRGLDEVKAELSALIGEAAISAEALKDAERLKEISKETYDKIVNHLQELGDRLRAITHQEQNSN